MKIFTQIHKISRLLLTLALPLLASLPSDANAIELMAIADPNAPCGTLHPQGEYQVGAEKKYYSYTISNQSKYDFKVQFRTETSSDGRATGHGINAGVVKYLVDFYGEAFWRDYSEPGADYTDTVTYTITIKAFQTLPIAFCASRSNGRQGIRGTLYLKRASYNYAPNVPSEDFHFEGQGTDPVEIWHNNTTYVHFNENSEGHMALGSFTFLPQ